MVKRFRSYWGWTALLLSLIFVIINSLIKGIDLVIRGVTDTMLLPIAIVGILVGWLLASSNLNGWWAALGGGTLGFALVMGQMGRLGAPLWRVIQEIGRILWVWLRWIETRKPASPEALRFAWGAFAIKTSDAALSLWYWLKSIFLGFPTYNYLANRVFWGIIIWTLALGFCWALRRYYRPLWGMFPAGMILGILLTYVPGHGRLWAFLILGAGLILIGLASYNEQEHHWTQKGIALAGSVRANSVRANMAWTVIGISLATVIIAAIIPSVSVNAITRPIQNWLWEDSDNESPGRDVLGVEYQADDLPLEVVAMAGLPRRHLIGTGPELAKRVVMVVRFPPGTPPKAEITPLAFYWRALSYDIYTGHGWKSSPTASEDYEPGQKIPTPSLEMYQTIQQEIRVGSKLRGALYVAGSPLFIDREFRAYWRATEDELDADESLPRNDIFAIALDESVYQVNSAVVAVDEEILRNASLTYPNWIEERYLALPEDIPQRVLDLAAEVVAGQPTAYDQARAIESYLRNFTYTRDLPDPPLEQDVVDYFLFDIQQGYCDYYATSMAVLARVAGLPARVVVGYSGGMYDEEQDRYLVTEADAHTWTEIYFPEVGWISFEPTAGRSVLERKENEEPLTVPPALDKPPLTSESQTGVDWSRFVVVGAALALSILMGFGVWAGLGVDKWLLARGTPSQTAERIYTRLHRWSARIGTHVPAAATPYEFQSILEDRLSLLRWDSAQEEGQTSAPRFISPIIKYYIKDRYRPILLTEEDEGEMVRLWRRLRGRLWLAQVIFIGRKFGRRVTETRFYVWIREIWSR